MGKIVKKVISPVVKLIGGGKSKSEAITEVKNTIAPAPAPALPEAPPQPAAEKVMPIADDKRVKLEKRKAIARRLSATGSASTILSSGNKERLG
jgi:hypothetical protein